MNRRARRVRTWFSTLVFGVATAMAACAGNAAPPSGGTGASAPAFSASGVKPADDQALSADQRAIVAAEGWPQTFRLLMYAAETGGDAVEREETWQYHDKGRRFLFLNGRLIGQGKADQFNAAATYPDYRPSSFRAGMSFDAVIQVVRPAEFVVEELSGEAMQTFWADRIVLGFVEDQLVYAETWPRFAAGKAPLPPGAATPLPEPRPQVTTPALPPQQPVETQPRPRGPVTVFADDFEGEGVTGTWVNWGSGYGAFKQWKVTRGAVDLVAEGGGFCVDLDGTWGMGSDQAIAGRMESAPFRLEAGDYRLSFRVKGNPYQGAKPGRAHYPNAFRVTLGAFVDAPVSLPHGAPWTERGFEFRVDTAVETRLVLDHTIVEGDWDGLFVDDIKLVRIR